MTISMGLITLTTSKKRQSTGLMALALAQMTLEMVVMPLATGLMNLAMA
jgi:hypothetical protein